MPVGLAGRIASLDSLHGAFDLVEVAKLRRVAVGFAAVAYFDVGERIGIAWIKQQIDALAAEGHWHAVARTTLAESLFSLHRKITAAALACPGREAAQRVTAWIGSHAGEVDYLQRLLVDLRTGAAPDFATLSVALQSVRRLAGE